MTIEVTFVTLKFNEFAQRESEKRKETRPKPRGCQQKEEDQENPEDTLKV